MVQREVTVSAGSAGVAGDGPEALRIAAELGKRYVEDQRGFLQLLATLLPTTLPDETTVERQGGLFGIPEDRGQRVVCWVVKARISSRLSVARLCNTSAASVPALVASIATSRP